jgi:hypothetical protein
VSRTVGAACHPGFAVVFICFGAIHVYCYYYYYFPVFVYVSSFLLEYDAVPVPGFSVEEYECDSATWPLMRCWPMFCFLISDKYGQGAESPSASERYVAT